MTQEQKARAYDEAIEKSKEFYILCKKCGAKDTVDFLEEIFPELKESEDDKIKEEIKVILANTDLSQFALDHTFTDMISWLEKQGKEDSSIQQAYKQGYIEGQRIERKCWLEKHGEQKPKWNEEDECYMGECISAIATKDGWTFEDKRKTKHWLKSLKRRMEE